MQCSTLFGANKIASPPLGVLQSLILFVSPSIERRTGLLAQDSYVQIYNHSARKTKIDGGRSFLQLCVGCLRRRCWLKRILSGFFNISGFFDILDIVIAGS